MSSTLGDTLLNVVVADAQLFASHDVDVADAQLDVPPLVNGEKTLLVGKVWMED